MPAPEALLALLRELDSMPLDDRAKILAALTRRERDLLVRVGQTATPADAADVALSPWLAAHIEAAGRGTASLTAAARESLIRAVGAPPPEPLPAGRSLAGAFGGLLSSRGRR